MSRFCVCTVITRDRFAHARVLARSVRRQHPDVTVFALVIDARQDEDGADEPFSLLTFRDIGMEQAEFERRATMYSAFELTGSLSAPLLLWALESQRSPAVYLDCDIRVYGDLTPLVDEAVATGVLLSPHEVEPVVDGPTEADTQYLAAGIFNAGFLAVGAGGEEFLRWWARRTARDCLDDPVNGMFVEQRWLSLAPGFFDAQVCRDPGANVMGWRLARHDVDAEQLTFMGSDLRFFHFCGRFDPRRPRQLTTMSELPWPDLADRPGAAALCLQYAQELLDAGYEAESRVAYLYTTLPDGRPLDQFMRHAYRSALIAAERVDGQFPPNPWADPPAMFMRWLATSAEGMRLSRYHLQLWRERLDLRFAFPAAAGDGCDDFERWILARPEHLVHTELRPSAERAP